jgi:hypothetical protein
MCETKLKEQGGLTGLVIHGTNGEAVHCDAEGMYTVLPVQHRMRSCNLSCRPQQLADNIQIDTESSPSPARPLTAQATRMYPSLQAPLPNLAARH